MKNTRANKPIPLLSPSNRPTLTLLDSLLTLSGKEKRMIHAATTFLRQSLLIASLLLQSFSNLDCFHPAEKTHELVAKVISADTKTMILH